MPQVEAKSQPQITKVDREVAWSPDPITPARPRRRRPILAVLMTFGAVAVAVGIGQAAWDAYMSAPWTRDGRVRAYVVTMAPEVSGRIVNLPVADNQLVHKGELLFEIDSSDYRIALDQGRAQAQHDSAALDYAIANQDRKAKLEKEGWATTDIYQQTTSMMHQSEALVALDRAAIDKAQLNLNRTQIRSPVNGYVTNLLAQRGDYANVGQNEISVIDADSFWVDGYFEETSLARIHENDPVTIKLMGYSQVVHGHVASVARGINVANAQPDQAGLASVNPIFTWVRLAQRVPVRIHIDQVPQGVVLAAGMTVTVQVEPAS